MKSHRRLLPFCLGLCAALTTAGWSAEPNATVTVGDRTITIPPPAGFVRCDGIFAEWENMRRAFVPATNRILALFGTPEDQARLKKSEAPSYDRNFNIQIVRQVEDREIGEITFAGAREEMKAGLEEARRQIAAQLKEIVADGSKKISDNYGVDDALSVSDTAFLGIFEDSNTGLGFTMAMKAKVKGPDGTAREDKTIVAGVMSPVNGRLLNFYATVPYKEETDRKIAENAVTGWRNATVAANPRVAGPDNIGGMSGTLRTALIGGAIGGAVALISALYKKKKAGAPRR